MRPRTATIQVSKGECMWYVEIGNPKVSLPQIVAEDISLSDALINAVLAWKIKEGLDD